MIVAVCLESNGWELSGKGSDLLVKGLQLGVAAGARLQGGLEVIQLLFVSRGLLFL